METDYHRHINRVTQRSEEEDKRIKRIGDLITLGVVLAFIAIAAKLCGVL